MSMFTGKELEYLQQQGLGRLATVGIQNDPHLVAVGRSGLLT